MLGDSTRCVEAVAVEGVPGDPLQPGPVLAAPYRLGEDESAASDTYARASNPGWRHLERALASLEGASSARVVGSGMSAITVALRSLACPGGVVVVPSDGYYQVRKYARDCLEPFGVVVRELSVSEFGDGTLTAVLADAHAGALVLVETPSNPGLDTVDLTATAATCRAVGALLLVDNTTATPLGQQPLGLGADVVVASGTKSLSGHSDLLFGYIAVRDDALLPRLDRERLLSGTVLGPFETWLAHRSLGTAGLRFERQCANAQAIAQMLAEHPAVADVRYPGLPTDPAHPVAAAQMRRFGPLVTFLLDDSDCFHRFVRRSELVVSATSFGGIHTTADRRARWGDPVPPGFVRLSCGIEDTEDLLSDLDVALRTS
ncbi:cystathionine gamma-lyase [Rhodococcus sp. HNM0563]|uniref:cystathionine gamma-lyase n=1 Tax=unclassified Rhodococcus (in: high G+C Gram-positive bacteria) TaxID=192944 RepID=UPI00146A909F|nr:MULTISPECIES: cystathionine gamma-lyase [unclassified Rhodococcus (in: high G+C Gram-positive bacteria)]MCK0090927.1 cystathionine gamma-lyase [Rhodococcus sp. F64268]NLU61031.1 cystathionine gamma-lyase [Rhodococcus sp. HNM0563]